MRKDSFDLEIAFKRLDIDALWRHCGREGNVSPEFEADTKVALIRYRPGPDPKFRLKADERRAHYKKLTKALDRLRDEIEGLHPQIIWELETAGTDFEPDEFLEATLGTEDEGLSYGEYVLEHLSQKAGCLSDMLSAAQDHNKTARGRPKQNAGLEQTISALGAVFEKYSGRKPLEGYRHDTLDTSQPYKGPFFDFLYLVFWSLNGREFPSGHAIGDAARRTLGPRK